LRERLTPNDGKEQAGVLRTVNTRLLEQMALQQKTLEMFRIKYRAMFEESRDVKEQN
jgi:acyl-[acyl carrier protein]--UDP-N-acetylglucosamine O-acyltransferase